MLSGICHLCGRDSYLTNEHVPPQSAFNDQKCFSYDVFGHKKNFSQNGNKQPVLCKRCNNDTGGWYAKYYVDFIRKCAGFLGTQNRKGALSKVYPLRVLKEILVMFVDTSSNNFVKNHNNLEKFLLNPNNQDLPDGLTIIPNIWGNKTLAHSSGLMGSINLTNNHLCSFSNILWWPIGWQLSLCGCGEKYDIAKYFSSFTYNTCSDINIVIP